MKNKKVYCIIICILLILLGFGIKRFCFPHYQIDSRKNEIKNKQSEVEEDVLGWIRVQGTNIDYPIIDGSTSTPSEVAYDYAWLSYDTDKIENRMAIFGHNLLNVSSYPLITNKNHRRFEQLLSFVYTEFVKENQYIQLTIGDKNYLYRIYSVYFTDEDDYGNNLVQEDISSYIEKAIDNSYFDFSVDINDNDKLITLITCTRFFGPTTDYIFKVEGRLVRAFEEIKQSKVSETENYLKIKNILKEGDKNAKI